MYLSSLQHSDQKRRKKMEIDEEQKEQVVVKLGVLCHLLESAAQVMQDITNICHGSLSSPAPSKEDIEKLIAEHADQGMEMIAQFLDEIKDVE